MKIISISGLDGSGKSTQVKLLKEYLEQRGMRVAYFHAVEFSLPNRFMAWRRKFCPFTSCSTGSKRQTHPASVIHATRLSIELRKFFLAIDLVRFQIYLLRARRHFDVLLTDRYFYDTVVNILYLSDQNRQLMEESFISKPDLATYLSTDPAAIMKRERVPDQGIEYLETKKQLYDTKAPQWQLNIIDGNRSQDAVFDDIKHHFSVIDI